MVMFAIVYNGCTLWQISPCNDWLAWEKNNLLQYFHCHFEFFQYCASDSVTLEKHKINNSLKQAQVKLIVLVYFSLRLFIFL